MQIQCLESEQGLRLLAGQRYSVRVRAGARLVVLGGTVRMMVPTTYPGGLAPIRLVESEQHVFAEKGAVVLEAVEGAELLLQPAPPAWWGQWRRRYLSRLQAWGISLVRSERSWML